MNFTLLENIADLSLCKLICIGYDSYLMLDGETMDDIHEIHTTCEDYPDGMDNYIYMDYESIVPVFFSVFDIAEKGEEIDFDSWEDAEKYFEA